MSKTILSFLLGASFFIGSNVLANVYEDAQWEYETQCSTRASYSRTTMGTYADGSHHDKLTFSDGGYLWLHVSADYREVYGYGDLYCGSSSSSDHDLGPGSPDYRFNDPRFDLF